MDFFYEKVKYNKNEKNGGSYRLIAQQPAGIIREAVYADREAPCRDAISILNEIASSHLSAPRNYLAFAI